MHLFQFVEEKPIASFVQLFLFETDPGIINIKHNRFNVNSIEVVMFYILYTPKKKLTVSFILKDVNIVFIMTPFAVICAVATLAIFVKRLQCVSARCTPSTILNCKGRETSFASCDSALDNCVLTPLVKRCPAIQDWVCVFKCWNCTIFGVSIASKTSIIYEESRV